MPLLVLKIDAQRSKLPILQQILCKNRRFQYFKLFKSGILRHEGPFFFLPAPSAPEWLVAPWPTPPPGGGVSAEWPVTFRTSSGQSPPRWWGRRTLSNGMVPSTFANEINPTATLFQIGDAFGETFVE